MAPCRFVAARPALRRGGAALPGPPAAGGRGRHVGRGSGGRRLGWRGTGGGGGAAGGVPGATTRTSSPSPGSSCPRGASTGTGPGPGRVGGPVSGPPSPWRRRGGAPGRPPRRRARRPAPRPAPGAGRGSAGTCSPCGGGYPEAPAGNAGITVPARPPIRMTRRSSRHTASGRTVAAGAGSAARRGHRHECRQRREGAGDDGRRLHARPPRVGPAVPPVAHGGELRGVPAGRAARRARRPGRGVRSRHDHGGPGRARRAGRTRHGGGRGRRRPRAGARGERGTRAGQRRLRRGGRQRAGLPRRLVRRGARPPGAPARRRPGGRAAGDAPGVSPRRGRRRTGQRLRRVHVVSRGAGAGHLAGAVPAGGQVRRRGAGRGPPAAVVGAGRGLHGHHPRGLRVVLRHPGGARLVERAVGGPYDAVGVRAAGGGPRPRGTGGAGGRRRGWREWGRSPDGWFLVPHGELLCRA